MVNGASAFDIFDILDGLVPEPEPAPPAPPPWTAEDYAAFDFETPPPPEPPVESRVATVPVNPWSDEYTFLKEDTVKDIQRGTTRLAWRLLQDGPHALVNMTSFEGNGVYALYYQGDDPRYEKLRSEGSTLPVYIGKTTQQIRNGLFSRLSDHSKSIGATQLGVENFTFRFIRLSIGLTGFAEYNLIEAYGPPLWNWLRGFGMRAGKRQPSDRPEQRISPWNTLHPGRQTLAEKPRELTDVEEEVRLAIPDILEAYHDMSRRIASLGSDDLTV